VAKLKPTWLMGAAEFMQWKIRFLEALFLVIFSPALILTLLVYAVIHVWEQNRDPPVPAHQSVTVLVIPWLVGPVLCLVWGIVLLIASTTVCMRLFSAH
jgi:hypothetical protein